ncbi:ubiquinol-cytochrome c reductase, iron-sulfur subunit [Burkholderia thailandensis]|nr:ubiquinol-cytochrome c reductase, iron-sulfur subunit [Burkholderia thailandensis]
MRDKEDKHVDSGRRTWLIATSVAGGVGGVATVIPFAASMAPSTKAKAAGAPVEVDISALKPGEMLTIPWRGKPVWVLYRTDDMLADVVKADKEVADPQSKSPYSMPLPSYCANEYRSRADHKNILVVMAVCTHLGCTPTSRFTPGPQPNLPDDWPGASCARATARPTTSPDGSSRTSRPRRIWTSRLICSRRPRRS